jgi:hypothetical protein
MSNSEEIRQLAIDIVKMMNQHEEGVALSALSTVTGSCIANNKITLDGFVMAVKESTKMCEKVKKD